MEITFKNPGVEYMIESILAFQIEENEFWSGPLYYFFPQIDKDYAKTLSFTEKKEYIEKISDRYMRKWNVH